MDVILRGEIYYAALDDAIGSEQAGQRPVLILQSDILNLNSPTAIIAPITSVLKRPFLQSHCILREDCPLRVRSMVLTEQVRTIDRQRLGAYVGMLWEEDMCAVEEALHFCLGLENRKD
jgi:mRNA interferase MazF